MGGGDLMVLECVKRGALVDNSGQNLDSGSGRL